MRFRFCIPVLALIFLQCRETARIHKFFSMDTNISVSLYGRAALPDDSTFALVDKETDRLATLFTDYSPLSPLSAVKGNIGDTVPVDPEVYHVLEFALEMAKVSSGSFDLTMHDLKSLWGIGSGLTGHIPEDEEIDSLMKGNPVYHAPANVDTFPPPLTLLPGFRAVLHRDHAQLDLGGIAKGYIVDRLHDMLDSLGCPNHIIQAGGEIRLGGKKKSGPWLVGIRHPRAADSLAGTLTFSNAMAISTSGDYERYFDLDGVRYHHIFDPRTGRPAPRFCAVTVVTDRGLHTDALSKPLFILGPEKGMALARAYHASAVWFVNKPSGVCAYPMPEMGKMLDLRGTPLCGTL